MKSGIKKNNYDEIIKNNFDIIIIICKLLSVTYTRKYTRMAIYLIKT